MTRPPGTMVGMASRPRTHFSMIRNFHLADLFTIANGFCGVASLFEAMGFLATGDRRQLYVAALLIPLAFVFDVLDGRIARWRHAASPMGREMDSLADVISFGVAPAGIAFAAGLNSRLDQLILMYFVGCGLSRLARFNITADELATETGKVHHFEGTPIPTSVVPLGLVMLAFYLGALYPVRVLGAELHLPVLLFFLSGSLMISKTLKIPKL
jgi:CDP-diacylglycerol--serine O-phosphatidyltransferase